jgi:hypothetical protein
MARVKGRYQKFHGRRALLNRPGQQTTAAIVAEVEDSSTWRGTSSIYDKPDITLQLANCDRSISFDVSIEDATYENDVEKIGIMIDALQKFRRGFIKERQRYLDRAHEEGWSTSDND